MTLQTSVIEQAPPPPTHPETILWLKDVSVHFGDKAAVVKVSMEIPRNQVTAIIGPSGCGKTTLLRTLNRMNDEVENCRNAGTILWGSEDLLSGRVDPVRLRKRIGMVFQKPNPFPLSIFENVAFGPRLHGLKDPRALKRLVDRTLVDAALWEEVKERLEELATSLSGGQQQRLCIARALSVEPEIILMDEPTSALDPLATAKIEDLIQRLKERYTVIIVTHNMQQAARVSDYTAFLYLGKLIEFAPTKELFESPSKELTENYITGRFG